MTISPMVVLGISAFPVRYNSRLYIIDNFLDGAGGQWSFFTGFADTGEQLFPAEPLPPLVLLNYQEACRLYVLISSETGITAQTLPPTAYSIIRHRVSR